MNFVAIDFETANEQRASACSIGLTTVTNGQFEDTVHYLIRPNELRFGDINTRKHGIRVEDVCNSPTFAELWPSIQPVLAEQLLVAHNASFDMSVLRGSLRAASIEVPQFKYLCSVQLAREAWPELSNYRLNFLAQLFGINLQHHNAGSDSRAAASLILLAAESRGLACPIELAQSLGVRIGEVFSHEDWIPSSGPHSYRETSSTEICLSDDYDISQHQFFQKNIEITGELKHFTKDEAVDAISQFGGVSHGSVTRKTQILVVGCLPAGASTTGKLDKARAWKEKGSDIQIISDVAFMKLISHPFEIKIEGN